MTYWLKLFILHSTHDEATRPGGLPGSSSAAALAHFGLASDAASARARTQRGGKQQLPLGSRRTTIYGRLGGRAAAREALAGQVAGRQAFMAPPPLRAGLSLLSRCSAT